MARRRRANADGEDDSTTRFFRFRRRRRRRETVRRRRRRGDDVHEGWTEVRRARVRGVRRDGDGVVRGGGGWEVGGVRGCVFVERAWEGGEGGGVARGGDARARRGERRGETRGVGDDEEDVLCPVCATRRVMMNRHVLFCACGGFRITRADEKVGLAYLRRRLAETFDAHGDRGCGRPSELRFDVRDAYGLDACVATCASCDFLEIVM